MKTRWLFLVSVAALVLAPAARAQIGEGKSEDARVKEALDEAGLKYTVDSDADFKLVYQISDTRTQVVYVNSNTNTYGNLEIREVWAPAYQSSKPIPANIANKMLEDSYNKKLGAWQVMILKDGTHVAMFAAKIAANSNSASLSTVIEAIAQAADDMEKELTGDKDEF